MNQFPVFLKLEGRPVLVVGGGAVATRRVLALLEAGATVTLVATRCGEGIRALTHEGRLRLHLRSFAGTDLEGQELVFVATDCAELGADVAREARLRGVWVNVADAPELCDFYLPARVNRAPLQIAIGTGGAAPALASRLREEIEELYPMQMGEFVSLLGEVRRCVREHGRQAMDLCRAMTDSQARRLWEEGHREAAKSALRAVLRNFDVPECDALKPCADSRETKQGLVTLVGAGPGDPDLITVAGRNALLDCDVLVYDNLLARELVALCPAEEKVFVGKSGGHHTLEQAAINRILIDKATEGKRVVRLKGGDPFVFGRGGEECLALAQAGVPYRVIPGVTAAVAAGAAFRFPLTHRELSRGVTLVTAHLARDGNLVLPWRALVELRHTLVFYMGVASLEVACRSLAAHGMSPGTPAALLERASTRQQREIRGTLGTIVARGREAGLSPPALLVVGDVLDLAEFRGVLPDEQP